MKIKYDIYSIPQVIGHLILTYNNFYKTKYG